MFIENVQLKVEPARCCEATDDAAHSAVLSPALTAPFLPLCTHDRKPVSGTSGITIGPWAHHAVCGDGSGRVWVNAAER